MVGVEEWSSSRVFDVKLENLGELDGIEAYVTSSSKIP